MKLVSLGWTAQSEIAARLTGCGLTVPELYAGQNEAANRQIADLCAALKHPNTEAAVLIVGPRAEVCAAVDPIRRELEAEAGKERTV